MIKTKSRKWMYPVCIAAPILLLFASLMIGRYDLDFMQVLTILHDRFLGLFNGARDAVVDIPSVIVWDIRLPRAIMALMVGATLAVCGGTLQGVFRNPLVDTRMMGVQAGAGFGASLAIILFGNMAMTYIFAFAFAIGAMIMAVMIGRIYKTAPTVTLVLGGVIVQSIFSALISFARYIANPIDQLPAITFWLMGSFARANYADLAFAAIPIGIGLLGIMLLRWRINVLAMGDKEARALGVNTKATRAVVIICTTIATAGAVSISGTIGWVGLVIPHIARMIIGNDNRVLLPVSLSLGASFMLIVDNFARTLTPGEIPLDILTALVGAPFFIYLLKKTKGGGAW
jgi:iron complex transport system permease protein